MTRTQKIVSTIVDEDGGGKNVNVAEKAGVSEAVISRLRSGKAFLRYRVFRALADAYPARESELKAALDDDFAREGAPALAAAAADSADWRPALRADLARARVSNPEAAIDFLDTFLEIAAESSSPMDFMTYLHTMKRMMEKGAKDLAREKESERAERAAKEKPV